jgi:hypothetical protein
MMPGITNWSEALAQSCFWTWHYALHLNAYAQYMGGLESFFGPAAQTCEAYGRLLYGDEDFETPLAASAEYVHTPASVLTLSFPENYTWALEFGSDGLAHQIYHPQRYPDGLLIAVESGNFFLPGLRWVELKQLVACLQPAWPFAFDVQTLYPLLYPVVDPVTFAEYDEVRQTLRTAWEALQLSEPFQLEKWLDAGIRVYEQGRVLHYDAAQGWHDPSGEIHEEKLWLPDPAGGWYTNWPWSMRHDARPFAPFFEMLERHTQTSLQ